MKVVVRMTEDTSLVDAIIAAASKPISGRTWAGMTGRRTLRLGRLRAQFWIARKRTQV